MGGVADEQVAIEPGEWFVAFHRTSASQILSFLAFGDLKHVSAFGYCPGVKLWLVYDVQWSSTRVILMDKAAIMAWSRGCDVLKIARTGQRIGLSSRLGLYCVSAVKHLIGLKCVAITPGSLYRHILRNGGIVISEQGQRPAAAVAGRPDARDRTAASAE
jgi:hypothetical protein